RKWESKCTAMVGKIRAYGVKDKHVLEAVSKVRRHAYISEEYRRRTDSYGDHPCQIGFGQTISQPYIVAYMVECMKLKPGERVLEIGTGSGYQSAILTELGVVVYSIEIIAELADQSKKVLSAEGYDKVHVLTGDGYKGWLEHRPFDAIIVTCAPEDVPQTLVDQLKEGGRMILPVGSVSQQLVILKKEKGKVRKRDDIMVRFVPMVRGGG
ncbi:protein-L-isoaspartate(D-aspartate) O-methyltransferase, partial [Verrucomicrobiota bacterium]